MNTLALSTGETTAALSTETMSSASAVDIWRNVFHTEVGNVTIGTGVLAVGGLLLAGAALVGGVRWAWRKALGKQ